MCKTFSQPHQLWYWMRLSLELPTAISPVIIDPKYVFFFFLLIFINILNIQQFILL